MNPRHEITTMRIPALTIFALMAIVACGGETSATDPADTSTSTMTPPDCTPGSEGCVCNAGACEAGLACYSEICVMPPAASTSATTSDPTTATTDDPSTSGDETTTSTTDASAETSTDDGADDSSSDATDGDGSTTAGSTTAGLEACAQEGNNFCGDGELHTCTDGVWNVRSCVDACSLSGLDSPGCADVSGCECDGFLDQSCSDAATGYCSCYTLIWEDVCGLDQLTDAYDACFDETSPSHGFITCMAGYPSSTYQECETAWIACSGF